MLKALLKFFTKILDKFTKLLLTPFITALTSLFPELSSYSTIVVNFLNNVFSFVPFCRDILMIPIGAISLFFDYLLIKYSIYLIRLSLKLGIETYNKFKI